MPVLGAPGAPALSKAAQKAADKVAADELAARHVKRRELVADECTSLYVALHTRILQALPADLRLSAQAFGAATREGNEGPVCF